MEVSLTPKEWGIRLADDLRQHSGEADFLRAIAKGEFRDSPYVKPFYVLTQQAEERHPGSTTEEVRARHLLDRRLRTEFQALKTLIRDMNDIIGSEVEISRPKIRFQALQLREFILQDVFIRSTEEAAQLVRECKTDCPNECERQLILEKLTTLASAVESRPDSCSLIEDWADDTAMLLSRLSAHKAAVETIEQRYFEDHRTLSRDIEAALGSNIQTVLEVIGIFNEHLQIMPQVTPFWPHKQAIPLTINAEAIRVFGHKTMANVFVRQWVADAKYKAVADGPHRTGEDEAFVWKGLRERLGVKPPESKPVWPR